MAYLFLTSDMHLGHGNVARYCGRPWANEMVDEHGQWLSTEHKEECTRKMNEALIYGWNSRVAPEDTVIHVGDFCCYGKERGQEGTRRHASDWESMLNGKIIHILGNHDSNNGVKHGLDTAVITHGGSSMFVVHRPIERSCEVPDFCAFVACGHIHEKWRHKWVEDVLCINVGVDVRGYMPMRADELIGQYRKILAEEGVKHVADYTAQG